MSNAHSRRLDAQLLTDLQGYFARQPAQHYPTKQLLNYLAGIDNASWATLTQGQAITARHLARMLQPYGIMPKTIRFPDGLAKGYKVADFADAFASAFVTDKLVDKVDVTDRIESAKGNVTDRRPVLADSDVTDSDVTDKLVDKVDVTDRIESAKGNVTDRRPVLADSDVTDSDVTDKVVDKVDVTDRKPVVAANSDDVAALVENRNYCRYSPAAADNVVVAEPAPAKPTQKWPPPKGWTWNHQTRNYEPPKPTIQTDPPDHALIQQTLCVSPSLKYLPGYGLVAVDPDFS